MRPINSKCYLLVRWDSVGEVVIMECQIKGFRIDSDNNNYYYCENSRFSKWESEMHVYSTIEEVMETLRERVVK